MKPIIIRSKKRGLLAGVALCAAGMMAAQASSSLITFSVDMSTNVVLGTFVPGVDTVSANGTFNGYGSFGLVQDQSQMPEIIYTNTVNDTADANGGTVQYKFVTDGSGWENTASGQNRCAKLPSVSGASLVLPTPFYGDAGAPVANVVTFQVDVSQQINLGNFTPGTSSVEVRGGFNGWTGGATTLTANPSLNPPGEPANSVWTGTATVTASPGAAEGFKYVIQPGTGWDSPSAANQDGGQNRYFANEAQTLPLVNFSDAAFVAALCTNVFSVDMTAPAAFDGSYDPTTVTLNGSFNGWGAAIPMTNNPSAANTNIFTSQGPVVYAQGGTFSYQFRYIDAGGTVYDHETNGQNRTLIEPNLKNYVVPTVYFNNQDYLDYLQNPVSVTFTIDMTGAVGTDLSVWSPGTGVFVNGPWPNWQGWDPISLSGQRLNESVDNPAIYTGTFTIPAGVSTTLNYKYSMGGSDNEAGQDANLIRIIRSTATGSYIMPKDTWANQYVEPSFGQLAVGPASAGTVQVSWLGRQGCQVQTTTSLSSPSWVSHAETDGTNWYAGNVLANGLVTATNWPASSGNLFFRLIKK